MKLVKYTLACLAGFFLVALALVIGFGYVNDHRVEIPNVAQLKPHKNYLEKESSLFTDFWDHQLDVSRSTWNQALKEVVDHRPQTIIGGSYRFNSDYQVYVALGSHPRRLQGMDAILVPKGGELTVYPEMEGGGEFDLTFSAAAFLGPAQLEVAADGGKLTSVELEEVDEPQNRDDFFYRNIGRFWEVSALPPGGQWVARRKPVNLGENSTLKFKCVSEKAHCVIAEPTLYKTRSIQKKNVLFIVVDTLRHDALQPKHAPFMAALAKKGVAFKHALTAGNMTSPATNAMLACRKPSELREVAFAYSVAPEKREAYYEEEMTSFPQVFAEEGYTTAMIGNVSVVSEVLGAGVNHGFDEQIALETEGYETPHLAQEALNWLQAKGNQPFFLYLHFNAPHAAYRPPLRDVFATFPGFGAFSSRAAFMQWMYSGEVAFTDRYVKEVVQGLEALGLKNNTTIVLTADHGDHFKPRHFFYNKAGLNQFGSFYDHGATLVNDEVMVPLVVVEKNLAPKVVEDYVQLLDIGPTLLDRHALEIPEWCVGRSLAAYLEGGPVDERLRKRVLASEGFRGRAIIFDNQYKYIRNYAPTKKRIYEPDAYFAGWAEVLIDEELYDLAKDPEETQNLIRTHSEILNRARKAYDEFYEVETEHQLVLESPRLVDFRIWLGGEADLKVPEGFRIIDFNDGKRILGRFNGRAVIHVKDWKPQKVTVNFNDARQDLLYTSMALPLTEDAVAKLPAEPVQEITDGTGEITQGRVFLRKVVFDEVKSRQIVAGNPAFEKVLREWGYIQEQ